MFYGMHVLTIIIICTFLVELEIHERNFGSYTRNGVMDYAQVFYSHEEEIRILQVIIGNCEIDSNGRRGRKEPITMRIPHREVKSYRYDNERIMKDQEEII